MTTVKDLSEIGNSPELKKMVATQAVRAKLYDLVVRTPRNQFAKIRRHVKIQIGFLPEFVRRNPEIQALQWLLEP